MMSVVVHATRSEQQMIRVDTIQGLSGSTDLVAKFLDVYLRKLLTLAKLFDPTVNFVLHYCNELRVLVWYETEVREKDEKSTAADSAPRSLPSRITLCLELVPRRALPHLLPLPWMQIMLSTPRMKYVACSFGLKFSLILCSMAGRSSSSENKARKPGSTELRQLRSVLNRPVLNFLTLLVAVSYPCCTYSSKHYPDISRSSRSASYAQICGDIIHQSVIPQVLIKF